MQTRTKVLIVIGVLLVLGLASKVSQEKSEYRQMMEKAVYIEDANAIDKSLAGQYVIISGVPRMVSGAYDADFNVQFEYPVVFRDAYVLYDTGTGSNHETSWQKAYRSEDYPYGSTDLRGVAAIGVYTFSDHIMNYIFQTSTDELVTEDLADQIGWTYYNNSKYVGVWLLSRPLTYKNQWDHWLDSGMMRFTYTAKSTEGIPCTIFGYLTEDGRIVSTEDYEMKYIRGILDKESFMKKY